MVGTVEEKQLVELFENLMSEDAKELNVDYHFQYYVSHWCPPTVC